MTAEHYFTGDPGSIDQHRMVSFEVGGHKYRLTAAGGVFSAARLDPGTAVLLRKAPLPPADTDGALLDLGCGYGPITAVLATVAPRAAVYAVDVNQRALDLVRKNATDLGVAGRVNAGTPDNIGGSVQFAQIWSNPPIRIGKPELHDMLRRWLPRLAPGGTAWLVVSRNLGGDSLHRWLVEQGWRTERHASQKGYRVLRVTR